MLVRIKKALLYYVVISLLLASSQAIAEPFCLVTSSGTECNYSDAVACQRDAVHHRGMCTVNSKGVRAPTGSYPFCLITSSGTECNYSDAESCQRDATHNRGACVINPNRAR